MSDKAVIERALNEIEELRKEAVIIEAKSRQMQRRYDYIWERVEKLSNFVEYAQELQAEAEIEAKAAS